MLLSKISARGSVVKSMTVTDHDSRDREIRADHSQELKSKSRRPGTPRCALAAHSTMLNLHM